VSFDRQLNLDQLRTEQFDVLVVVEALQVLGLLSMLLPAVCALPLSSETISHQEHLQRAASSSTEVCAIYNKAKSAWCTKRSTNVNAYDAMHPISFKSCLS